MRWININKINEEIKKNNLEKFYIDKINKDINTIYNQFTELQDTLNTHKKLTKIKDIGIILLIILAIWCIICIFILINIRFNIR